MAKQQDPELYPLSAGSAYERENKRNRLAHLFRDSGMTRKELAEAVGLISSKGAEKVSRWLEHPEEIDAETVKKLAHAFGKSDYYLTHGTVPRKGLAPILWTPTDEVPDYYGKDSASIAYSRLDTDAKKAVTTLVGTILESQGESASLREERDKLLDFALRAIPIVWKLCELCEGEDVSDDFLKDLLLWRRDAEGLEYRYLDEPRLMQMDEERDNEWMETEGLEELRKETEEILRETRYRGRRKQQPPTE